MKTDENTGTDLMTVIHSSPLYLSPGFLQNQNEASLIVRNDEHMFGYTNNYSQIPEARMTARKISHTMRHSGLCHEKEFSGIQMRNHGIVP